MTHCKAILKMNGGKASPYFRPFCDMKRIRKGIPALIFLHVLFKKHFNQPNYYPGHPKLYENISRPFPRSGAQSLAR
jgi:hypothetical protein